jgi:hypothetical protein
LQKAIKLLDSKSAAISRINFASNLISKVESDQQLLNLAINQLDEAKKFSPTILLMDQNNKIKQ